MELHLPSIPLLLVFLLFLVMVMKIRKRYKTHNLNSRLPPGPRKLPFIGNLHNMLGLPHHSLRNLANKHGPLMHLQLGEVSAVVVSSAQVAEQVMKTHDLCFADRPSILAAEIMTYGLTDVAFAPYGNYWRQLRKIFVTELLSTKRVQSFRYIREEEVSNLIQNISSHTGSPINLSEKLFSLTNDVTSRAAFGKKSKDKEAFMASIKEVFILAGGFGVADLFPSLKFLHVISGMKPKLVRLHRNIDKILDDIIRDHQENSSTATKIKDGEVEDLVDVLLRLQQSGELEYPITKDNVKAAILDIFSAGTDTATTTLEWIVSELLKNPRVMKKVQAELRQALNGKEHIDETDIHKMNYLKLVIRETLRLHPAFPLLLPRECREKCLIDGYEIPTKTKIIVNAWAIGRNPEQWSNAEMFEPERFIDSSIDYKGTNFDYIPFGAGRRMCPGASFGIANIELPLAQLLYHFDWELPVGIKPDDLDMTEVFGSTVRRRNELYLIPNPYSPSLIQ